MDNKAQTPEASATLRPATTLADLSAASPLGTFVLLSCVMIWGVNAVAFKVGGRTFDPILLNGLRFLLVAPCLVVIIALKNPSALRIGNRQDVLRYAVYGFVSVALGETMMALSVQYTSVANMTLLGPGTISLFTALWAVALREQTLTRVGWIGALVSFVGVGIVAAQGLRFDTDSLRGDIIALSRSAIHGAYLLLLTRTLRERPIATVTVYNVVFAAGWLLPYVWWKAPDIDWGSVPQEAWWSLLWTVVPTTVYGYLVWNWAMRHVGAVASTNYMYLLPVFAAIAGWVILKEPLTIGQVLGGVVIVGGIVVLRWDTLASAGIHLNLPRVRLPWKRY